MTLLKSRKIGLFAKGLTHGFDYLQERKQPFPDYKNDIRRKSKNRAFSKGVNAWF